MVDPGKRMEQESGMDLISLSPRHRSKISQPSAYLRKTCNCLAKKKEKTWWIYGTFAVWNCIYSFFQFCLPLSVSPSTISSPSVTCLKSRLPLEKTAVRSVTRISKFQKESRNTCQVQVWKVATGCCTQVPWSKYHFSGHSTRHHIHSYSALLGFSRRIIFIGHIARLKGLYICVFPQCPCPSVILLSITITAITISTITITTTIVIIIIFFNLCTSSLPKTKTQKTTGTVSHWKPTFNTSTIHSHLKDSQGGDTAPGPKLGKGVKWIQNELQGNAQNTQPHSEICHDARATINCKQHRVKFGISVGVSPWPSQAVEFLCLYKV